MISDTARRELASIVGDGWLRTSSPDLLAYNADCSPRGIIRARGRELDETQPAAVVQPADEEELVELVEWARERGTALVPYGAGSGVCLGAVGDRASVIVDLKRLDRILEVDGDNLYARVQPGIVGMVFERKLRERGLTMGHFPSSLYCSSLGGYAAARSAGQLSSRFGKMEDMVASLRVVTGRGDVVETSVDPLEAGRNAGGPVGGPNPTQIFIGSEGTLGFVTEMTVHLEPEPRHTYYRGFECRDLGVGLAGIRRVMQEGIRPSVVRLYDPYDSLFKSGGSEGVSDDESPDVTERLADLVEQYVPEAALREIRDGAASVRDTLVAGVLDRTGLVQRCLEPFADSSMLIVGFEGRSEAIEAEAESGFRLLREYADDLGPGPGENWLEHRFDTSYLQSPIFETGAWVDTMEISTTWENLGHLYRTVRGALEPHAFTMAHFSHVYPEGSSIYFTFVGGGRETDEALERHESAWEAALDAVVEAGGSITHHHGVGALKRDWVEQDHLGGRRHFEALKTAFDPDRVMNPGTVYPPGDTT